MQYEFKTWDTEIDGEHTTLEEFLNRWGHAGFKIFSVTSYQYGWKAGNSGRTCGGLTVIMVRDGL